MLVAYAVWLAHKAADVMSEVAVLADRTEQLVDLLSQIQRCRTGGLESGDRSTATSQSPSGHRALRRQRRMAKIQMASPRLEKRNHDVQVPLMFGLGVPELLIILAVVLLLFGGARLAGLGKSTGRAIKEFKEETKGLKAATQNDGRTSAIQPAAAPTPPTSHVPAAAAGPAPRTRRPAIPAEIA